ncbi:hypothetical protein BN1213_01198 [Mycobacterium tuberculosis]|nr:hypothetical protein BN1213_01198 [Mycobacterium tuberculosis]
MMRRPITLAEQLDAEDAKLVVLARAAMARAEAGAGAAVRELAPTAAIIVTDRAGNPL